MVDALATRSRCRERVSLDASGTLRPYSAPPPADKKEVFSLQVQEITSKNKGRTPDVPNFLRAPCFLFLRNLGPIFGKENLVGGADNFRELGPILERGSMARGER